MPNTVLETPRLILRHLRDSDAEAMFRGWASDPQVTRFLAYLPCASVQETQQRLAEWFNYLNTAAPDSWELFIIRLKATGELIGTIDYAVLDREARSAEVGYQLGRAWWGNGYTAEALKAVLAHCFETVGLNRVWADYDSRNPSSGRVMQKAGMRCEGTSRQCRLRRGETVSTVHYAMLAQDYFGQSAVEVLIIPYDGKHFADMLLCYLSAKEAVLAYAPPEYDGIKLKADLLDIEGNYLTAGEAFFLALDSDGRVVGMAGTKTESPTDIWLKRLFASRRSRAGAWEASFWRRRRHLRRQRGRRSFTPGSRRGIGRQRFFTRLRALRRPSLTGAYGIW